VQKLTMNLSYQVKSRAKAYSKYLDQIYIVKTLVENKISP